MWVSFRDWNGIASIFDSESVGLANYRELLTDDGVRRTDFAISLRNNLYYVLGVVPIQTIIAFVLAVILNQKFLKGKGFFRTAYYFPSITSSIAITLIFVFLFQTNGAVNSFLPIQDIDWLDNARGVIHNFLGVFGVEDGPSFLTENEFMGLELWDWLSGPSVAMVAIMMLVTWTSVGTFMLIFLAGLQNISPSVEEAAVVDGANSYQRFFRITIPLMRPTIFFVVTLGLIGTWQVFDQVYAGTAGGPRKTTFTPAYLIYFQAFTNSKAGLASAIAVILFAIIMFFTWVNRKVIRDTGDF
ncbi:MAG TPA: sugar ABC transporter permease [Acidimicrobiia bacterium]|nr:sugar ABC transporter permease [Acidimicrobiia bacterium]